MNSVDPRPVGDSGSGPHDDEFDARVISGSKDLSKSLYADDYNLRSFVFPSGFATLGLVVLAVGWAIGFSAPFAASPALAAIPAGYAIWRIRTVITELQALGWIAVTILSLAAGFGVGLLLWRR